jgi:hypothetical protein
MPANPSFERLLQLGEQQGGLTPLDLQQVLDVERLSTEELSDMLVRLDQAGVSESARLLAESARLLA